MNYMLLFNTTNTKKLQNKVAYSGDNLFDQKVSYSGFS